MNVYVGKNVMMEMSIGKVMKVNDDNEHGMRVSEKKMVKINDKNEYWK